jgi:hypothetical protein
MPKAIDIDVAPLDKIPLNFGGDHYLMRAPKGSLTLSLAERAKQAVADENVTAMWDEIEEFFRSGLGKKQWERLHARLYDPEDPLDVRHLVSAMESLVEVITEGPTSSPSD